MGQKLDEGKKSMLYQYQYSPSHVDKIMFFSLLQL